MHHISECYQSIIDMAVERGEMKPETVKILLSMGKILSKIDDTMPSSPSKMKDFNATDKCLRALQMVIRISLEKDFAFPASDTVNSIIMAIISLEELLESEIIVKKNHILKRDS